MHLDILVQEMRAHVAQERLLLHRLSHYVFPLLVLPMGFVAAQVVRDWQGLFIGGLTLAVLLAHIALLSRPILTRARTNIRDIRYYLGVTTTYGTRSFAPILPLLIPSVVVLTLSMAMVSPVMLAEVAAWQRLLVILLGIMILWTIWEQLITITTVLNELEKASIHQSHDERQGVTKPVIKPQTEVVRQVGLLNTTNAERILRLPFPPLALSPAGHSLLRIEAYLLLQENADISDQELTKVLHDLAQLLFQYELRHQLLPPIGGKIYLPISTGGVLASLLRDTVRCFGMDGGYSASLGTWLIRLPPAYSYHVASRLMDAIATLHLLPEGSVLPHHLTIQGNLGQDSRILSLLYLAGTPLIMQERSDNDQEDQRSFIMRGGGVLDTMDGRGQITGSRTDFIDGFLIVGVPELTDVEKLTIHSMNLRIKQILAYGIYATDRTTVQQSPIEAAVATVYLHFRKDLRQLLEEKGLQKTLSIDWIDSPWNEIWPWIKHLNRLKEHDPRFLEQVQSLRDRSLDSIEELIVHPIS
ncbi:MAG: hypothetical protein AAGF95_04490 [Chloroflexota bacterium]